MRRVDGLDLSIAGLGLVCGGVVIVGSNAGVTSISLSAHDPGPYVSADAIAVVMMILSLGLLIQTIAKRRKVPPAAGHDGPDRREILAFTRLAFIFVGYVAALWCLGFIIATLLCLVVFYRILGATSWFKGVLISVSSTGLIFYIFKYLLEVQLPSGIVFGG